jgi:thioredoxin-like negative regulator of GroEL
MISRTEEGSPGAHRRDALQTVTGSTFGSLVLAGEGPIAVEFMSYGCAHCRALEPILQQVATRVAAEERLFRVNIAVEEGLAESYGIKGTPTLIMFLNGQEVGRVDGPRPTVEGVLAAVTQPFES